MKNLLEWKSDEVGYIKGYLQGHEDTTLFLLIPHGEGAKITMLGSMMPDADEQNSEPVEPSMAKVAAEQYLRTWIKQHALTLAQQILTES